MKRYRDNKPIPISLEMNVYDHFRYYWKEVRLAEVCKSDFLDRLPEQLRRTLIIHYMFDDIIHSFRQFFIPQRYGDDKLLELMCYGLYPRFYDPSNREEEYVIYDEGDEVLEIIFIVRG
jgi:hypothetical protein